MLKIEIYTPGKVLQLPHNGEVVRTPYYFNVEDDSFKSEFEGMFRVKGIDKYKISFVKGSEDIVEKTIPKHIKKIKPEEDEIVDSSIVVEEVDEDK